MRVRFGPAGKPVGFKGKSYAVPKYLREIGLDAFEYQAVRSLRVKKEDAEALRRNAEENDVLVSLHAPYAINMCSKDDKVFNASIERLVKACEIASLMGAYLVVFHPGYYKGHESPESALKRCVEGLKRVVEQVPKGVLLGPETMGRKAQFGTVDEIIRLCSAVDRCKPVLDFAHIYARCGGCLKKAEDFIKVIEKFVRELGEDIVAKPLHIHFTKVDYDESGEKSHVPLAEKGYGPEFEELAKALVELGYDAVIISESPLLDKDALVMKSILEKVLKERGA